MEGTLNGDPAQGTLVRAFEGAGPNLLFFFVLTFDFGRLHGSGTAEFFTIENRLTLIIDAIDQEASEVHLSGSTPDIPEAYAGTLHEFTLSAPGYSLMFNAVRDPD